MTTTIRTIRITGDSLIQFVNAKMELVNRGEITRTDMIKDAGYLNDNGSVAYTDFYTELLKAKEVLDPNYVSKRDAEDAEYDAMSGVEQEMYDAVHEKLGEKWDHEEITDFMKELDDIGIETPEQLFFSYEYTTDSYKPEEEFAEYFVIDVMDARIPDIVEGCIDWQTVWNSALRYDYNTIEFGGDTYFFRNI
jgi:hypothetical protein